MGGGRRSVVGAATLLGASGLLTVAAAAERWWPSCGLGSFDTDACLRVQDDAYDSMGAAELQGLGLLLLAAAVVLLPAVLTGRRQATPVNLATWVVAGGVAAVAVVTWLSGRAGEVVTVPGLWVGAVLWLVAFPVLVICLAATGGPAPGRGEAGRWALVAFLVASNPLGDLVLTPLLLGYTSHDTTPWTGAVSGLFLMAAAATVVLTARSRRDSGAESEDQPGRLSALTHG